MKHILSHPTILAPSPFPSSSGLSRGSLRNAFSLVELSIVLVILGLLTGGILAGQSLIRAAELRSVTADIQRYQSALYSFRDKYMGLPGDITNAERFWGSDATCPATPANQIGKTATCNGDGNGSIYSNAGLLFAETHRAWQQLANAGLVEGSYSGTQAIAGAGNEASTLPGVNIPAGRIGNSGFYIQTLRNYPGSAVWFPSDYGTLINFGTGNSAQVPILKAEEQWSLDTKLDDGLPAQGRVMSFKGTARVGCASSDALDATYLVSGSSIACNVVFKTGL